MNILGVRIDNVTKQEALKKAADFLTNGAQHTIFTPNPEMLVDAHHDRDFKNILNSSSLNLCDGFGIQFVAREKIDRIPGADFMLDLCQLATQQGIGVYLLGGKNINQTVNQLQKQFPHLKITGYNSGIPITQLPNYQITYTAEENDRIIADIVNVAPTILFVGFGHKKQETWIHENLSRLPSVKIAMGVGGAFDFIAGEAHRAPIWMRNMGLEWFWRLMIEPWRIKRIWKATVEFLFVYFTAR